MPHIFVIPTDTTQKHFQAWAPTSEDMGWRHDRIFDTPAQALDATGVTGADWVLEPLRGIVRELVRSVITQVGAMDNTINDMGNAVDDIPDYTSTD